jgi:hypothetical protein
MDAGPVLLRFCLYLAGGRACSGNAIRDVVDRRDRAKPVRTKIATVNFKLRHYRLLSSGDGRGIDEDVFCAGDTHA